MKFKEAIKYIYNIINPILQILGLFINIIGAFCLVNPQNIISGAKALIIGFFIQIIPHIVNFFIQINIVNFICNLRKKICKNPFSLAVFISGLIIFNPFNYPVTKPIFIISLIVVVFTFIYNEVREYDMLETFNENKDNLYLYTSKIQYEDAVKLLKSGKIYCVCKEDSKIIIKI